MTRTVVKVVGCALLITALGARVSPAETAAWQPVERSMVPIARPSDSDLESTQGGTRAWHVRFSGDKLEVSPWYSPRPQPQVPFDPAIDTAHLGSRGTQPSQALRAGDVWFLSYNHGEFGGGLWLFSADGKVGRRLLEDPILSLVRYQGEILAVTVPNVMFFWPPLRIHRFGLKDGRWQEVDHVDFPEFISLLPPSGAHLYGLVRTKQGKWDLSELDLRGGMRTLWRLPERITLFDFAIARNGDMAIGGAFVARLRPHADVTAWYASPDCVQYQRAADDRFGTNSRCVAKAGVKPYELRKVAPIVPQGTSADGRWMLGWGVDQVLLRISDPNHAEQVPLPNEIDYYSPSVASSGEDVVLVGKALWLRRAGEWSKVASTNPCSNQISLAGAIIWCAGDQEAAETSPVYGIRYDGSKITASPTHRNAQLVVRGLSSDAWFSEKDASFLGHVAESGTDEVAVSSPIQSLSHGETAIWFSEEDRKHFGFVDEKKAVHEFTEGPYQETVRITGAGSGAWLRETSGSRVVVRHVGAAGPASGIYATDVRATIVTRDGALWAQSSDWPTIARLTEGGEMTRYLLPCTDSRLSLSAGPQNGIWFRSLESHCSGFIDANGISVRDFPSVESVYHR